MVAAEESGAVGGESEVEGCVGDGGGGAGMGVPFRPGARCGGGDVALPGLVAIVEEEVDGAGGGFAGGESESGFGGLDFQGWGEDGFEDIVEEAF